ncbi:tetratricopeptide repeat protein [Clostridium sp. P21]|uniref:Tetratricopeptide repeat protein n=1 Tax=Clostridium muellerianum TaxID=2716538 RepID=A0A7Y0EFS2_9CLOT|nr:tetratricopeptide repeat protein [Clostridium muellerianum]NMM62645.1 tetratricopeptide repeat protein [Clostridium muellerianum]
MKDSIQINKYLEKAEKAFEENKLIKALDLYNKVYELSSGEDVDAVINLALIYDSLGKSEKAEEYYRKALSIDDYEERAYYGLATIYDEEEKYEEAIKLYNKAIYINPNYHKAYFFLANAYDVSGEKDLAIETYEKLLSLNSLDFWANLNLGCIYEEQNENALAYKKFSKALKINPNNHLALFNMGVICYKFNIIEKAINFYERAIEKDTNYEYSYLNLAIIYKYDDTKKGIEILSKGINNCSEAHFLYYNRSCFYALINEESKACEDIIIALKLYPQFLKYIFEDEELENVRKLNSFKEFVANYSSYNTNIIKTTQNKA